MGRLGGITAVVVAAVGLGAAGLVAGAAPAAASMLGPCTATGTFVLGTGAGPIVVDVAKVPPGQAVTIPAADTIAWTATAPAQAVPRPIRGRIEIDLPWPFGTQTLDSWGGTGASAAQAGTYTYELTGAVPRGVAVKFVGTHAEPGVVCVAELSFKVSGGVFDAWIGFVAVGGLLLSGAVFFLWGGRATWGRL